MFGSANNAEIFKFKLRHKTKPFYAKNNGEKQSQSQVLQLCYFLIIGMPAGAFLVDNLVGGGRGRGRGGPEPTPTANPYFKVSQALDGAKLIAGWLLCSVDNFNLLLCFAFKGVCGVGYFYIVTTIYKYYVYLAQALLLCNLATCRNYKEAPGLGVLFQAEQLHLQTRAQSRDFA